MADPRMLLDTLAEFARTLTHGYEISDVLHDLTDRVVAVLDLTGAGVALIEGDRLCFVTSDTEFVNDLERVQEEHQAGPCIEASHTGGPVVVGDLRAEADRWPAYAELAASIGVAAVAGIPLRDGGPVLGALTLYDRSPRAWSADDLDAARVLADVATSYVINASKIAHQTRTNEQLARALESRIVIEQAKGIIAAHHGITVDAAFLVLRKHANDHNANLHATAAAVVRLGLRP